MSGGLIKHLLSSIYWRPWHHLLKLSHIPQKHKKSKV